ncbi:uncharacterized protein BDV17DRAFT_288893 [Aspergillus undulatus]|uniref:uncharacterized protein n=1 Tax=Aspergillus undulatus TaxID=1810928 RepID=UPI003CCCF16A
MVHDSHNLGTGLAVTCLNFSPEELDGKYCGVGNDEIGPQGCWTRHFMRWNNQSSVNFTITFNDDDAQVYIWAEEQYTYSNDDPANFSTRAEVSFWGWTGVPSIGSSVEFWDDNSELRYEDEIEKENETSVNLWSDEAGYPVFHKISEGISYVTRNFTYSAPSETDMAAGLSTPNTASIMFIIGVSILSWSGL